MENYVVSRELAEQLKAAGYDQEDTMFMWTLGLNGKYGIQAFAHITPVDMETAIAAPLSDELLEQLPLTVRDHAFYFTHWGDSDHWETGYVEHANYHAEKAADALAELWLWCKAEGHINA